MRNNKLIKAQYERLVDINMQRGKKSNDMYNVQEEAEMFGFWRNNIRTNPEQNSSDESEDN